MLNSRRLAGLLCVLLVLASWLCPQSIWAQEAAPDAAAEGDAADGAAGATIDPANARLFDDFMHYILVARPELAASVGQSLLDATNEEKLLDIVEASDFADRYRGILDPALKTETVAGVAREVSDRIDAARIARARDESRILADIRQLAQGGRPAAAATGSRDRVLLSTCANFPRV